MSFFWILFPCSLLYSVELESSFYSGFLLIILQRVVFISNFSFPLPTSFPFGNHKVLCYVVRVFPFGKEVHLFPF